MRGTLVLPRPPKEGSELGGFSCESNAQAIDTSVALVPIMDLQGSTLPSNEARGSILLAQ